MNVFDLTPFGVTVHGQLVAAIERDLALTIAELHHAAGTLTIGTRTAIVVDLATVAVKLAEVLAVAVDVADVPGEPAATARGTLYLSRVDILTPDGVDRLYVLVEDTTAGLIAYEPDMTAGEQSSPARSRGTI